MPGSSLRRAEALGVVQLAAAVVRDIQRHLAEQVYYDHGGQLMVAWMDT